MFYGARIPLAGWGPARVEKDSSKLARTTRATSRRFRQFLLLRDRIIFHITLNFKRLNLILRPLQKIQDQDVSRISLLVYLGAATLTDR